MANLLRRRNMLVMLAGGVMLASGVAGWRLSAAQTRTGGSVNRLSGDIALKGYDPVAYFTAGKPVKGSESFSHEWQGARWLFASAEHRETFQSDPRRYAPQFGGFCAWGVSHGYLVDVDPENAWAIVDGKLYVNYDAGIAAMWRKDQANQIRKAEETWPTLDR